MHERRLCTTVMLFVNLFKSVVVAVLCIQVGADDILIDVSYLELEKATKQPSFSTGKIVSEWDPHSESNPEELGEYAEGDILFPKRTPARNGLLAETTRWPDGVIPFEIKGDFNAFQMATIEEAINEYHNKTCIVWKKLDHHDKDYVSIVSTSTGCWSSVGRVGGRQEVNLQTPSCLKRKGTVIHELMHAVGFFHEQNREERDNHITVVWSNIQKFHRHNFDKAPKDTTYDFGVPYDYDSVMHYSEKAFSVNGKKTIVPVVSGANIGQRVALSPGDIYKINRMYKC